MIKKLLILLVLSLIGSVSYASVDDSTGLVLKNNKVFIIHEVTTGESLITIGKHYRIPWKDIVAENPGSNEVIYAGKKLYIPTHKTEKEYFGNAEPVYSNSNSKFKKQTAKAPKTVDTSHNKVTQTFTLNYTVSAGETLYTIATKFNTTVDFLMQLNKLSSPDLEIGKEILVPVTEEESKKAAHNKDTHKKTAPDSAQTKPKTVENTETHSAGDNSDKIVESVRITETGMGLLLVSDLFNPNKYEIVHRDLPVGKVIQITNPINGRSVYVKVIGNIKPGEAEGLLLYVNKNTADYLELNKKERFKIKTNFAK
jgi:LysM repeat protein